MSRLLWAAAWTGLATGVSGASDWDKWRGPARNGISAETAWKPQAISAPKVKWKAQVGVGYSAPSITGKKLLTMGNQGGKDIVWCLDAETGKPLWQHSYPCHPGPDSYKGPRVTPVVDGTLVYTLGPEGQAYCLELETGKVKWQKDLIKDYRALNVQWRLAGSPLIAGSLVIYNARSAGLALDKATGEKAWESPGGECGYAAPVLFTHEGKDCVAIFSAHEVVVSDAKTGARITSHPWETNYNVNAADPVYVDGKLFISSGYDRGCALLDLAGGRAKVLWENQSLASHFASPIHLNGVLYGISGNTPNGDLVALDVQKGKKLWTENGNYENFMIAGGKIVAIDRKGVVVIGDATATGFKPLAKGTVLSGRGIKWTAPVLANGLLYCRDSEGELVCVDLR
jgi:outer membrane protein assembly factor BamB